MRKYYLQPRKAHRLAVAAANVASSLPYTYIRVVGVSRGGFFLAQYVAYALEKQGKKVHLRSYQDLMREKSVFKKAKHKAALLVCDDVLDSGATFDKIAQELRGLKLVPYFFTLVDKGLRPDWAKSAYFYSPLKLQENPWISFPWDIDFKCSLFEF